MESVSGPRKLAEFSFIGFDPFAVLRLERGILTIEDRRGGDALRVKVQDPLPALRQLILSSRRADATFRFLGGAVGYVSYDAVRYWERIPHRLAPSGYPDMEFALYDKGIIIDHRMNEAYQFSARGEEMRIDELGGGDEPPSTFEAGEARRNMKEEDFMEMVLRAKEYIESGDIYQVVLSKRIDVEYKGSLLSFYEGLKEINPSPYMYLLEMGERTIVGSSPEMLFRVESGRIETFPIAGTRPAVKRGGEAQPAPPLREDPKELAEHVMLVDLARNDLGRICRFGTVKVDAFMEVHEFSHVQHMVSHVVGELRLGLDCLDALRATFPAGTVSGAPKVRAMEIIDELEPDPRGPYAGCVGYLSFNGSADFAITIRTLTARGVGRGVASVQAGAGIVADSVPEGEWMETEHKAAALLSAMRRER